MKNLIRSCVALVMTSWLSLYANPLVYEGASGAGKGKHIVFLASDHEYRSEEAVPALAKILAKHHGFKCTVLFGLNDKGEITAGAPNIPGMEALEDADLCFIFTRWIQLPDDQMAHLDNYVKKGGPLIGLRTSSHAFSIDPKNKYYEEYDSSRIKGKEFREGFGHKYLGNTWVGHYGRNHRQGTRIEIVPEQKDHVILQGVEDGGFCFAGAYVGKAREGFTVLVNSQPLVSMDPKADADSKKPAMPCTWTRHYETADGKKHRVFHSTQGASQDFLDENYRRLILNGTFWAIGLEDKIKPNMNIEFVGEYQPTNFSFKGGPKGIKPSDYEGWDSLISNKRK